MNERYTESDFETLIQAEFKFREQMRHIENKRKEAYTTQEAKKSLKELEEIAIAERRQVYIALGLEEPDDNDIIT